MWHEHDVRMRHDDVSKWHVGMMMCRLRVPSVAFVHARVRVCVYVQVACACSGGMRHVPYAHHATCGVCVCACNVCNVRRVRARVPRA
jgi:hypothetical protein